MGFWVTTLTLLIWPYVSWRFDAESSFLGLSATYWGLASIGAFVGFMVLIIGVIYDQFLGLWKEQRTVDTERNPFGTYALIPGMTVMMGNINEILRRTAPDDEDIQATCSWVDEWLEWCGRQEIWVRAQAHWDAELPTPTPNMHFFPDGVVDSARGQASELEDL